jgi:hypothetical protein
MRRVVMEAIYPCVAGLDVHQKVIVACRRRLMGAGQVESEVERFGTTTRELQRLAAWLAEWSVRQVAMESTGALWQPVWNVLCEQFELLLVNAQHLKKVPGRAGGCHGCGMDRAMPAMRFVARELCAERADSSVA